MDGRILQNSLLISLLAGNGAVEGGFFPAPPAIVPCGKSSSASALSLTRFAVNYLVDRIGKAAGFDNLHPHCLRHSCGYALADKGIDLRTMQEWLGHRSIEMTVRYTRIRGDLMGCGVKRTRWRYLCFRTSVPPSLTIGSRW